MPIFPLTTPSSPPTPTLINFDFLNVPHLLLNVTQSCNGLLLVEGTLDENQSPSTLFVCNPITKRFATITGVPKKSNFFLAYDPLKSLHFKLVSVQSVNRLGWSDATLDWDDYSTHAHKIAIYSSETACWSDTRVCFVVPSTMKMHLGVYCNGSVHWYLKAKESFYFDVENQCLKTYPMPPNIENHEKSHFSESRGRLHMMLLSPQLLFDIYELKEDYSAWSLRFHRLDLSRVHAPLHDLYVLIGNTLIRLFHMLCVAGQEKEQDFMLMLIFHDGTLFSYNVVDNTITELSEFESIIESRVPWFEGYAFRSFEFIQNLSPVGVSTA
uniref:F-box protein At5g07610 family n=2 Tax=Cajanus cajan TaxID=3821 RepID=A0A151QXX5_CAJCA|nr:F-box protein At5g07610 family [Cajanus cajan]